MTESATVLPGLPMQRPQGRPLDPPDELAAIRREHPIVRMTYPDGHLGWLVTGYEQARAVLGDTRISNRFELVHFPHAPIGPSEGNKAPVGAIQGLDAPEHTRFRKLLMGKFTVRRMRLLTDRIQQITTEHLDAMERDGSPLDLVDAFAWPIPALVICELLGVPETERPQFKRLTERITDPSLSMQEVNNVYMEAVLYLSDLAKSKRTNPTDDVLSELGDSDLTDEEHAGLGTFLLGAGLETTAKMLSLGTLALLQNPEQFAAWRADPALTDGAVEELMRYLTITHTDVRSALVDVEVDGQVIEAGQTVTISYIAANRDPAKFPDPDSLDLRRQATGHIGFSHGAHQCVGQQLARVEMRIAFPALLERFPDLRLDVDAGQLSFNNANVYGLSCPMPVAWGPGR